MSNFLLKFGILMHHTYDGRHAEKLAYDAAESEGKDSITQIAMYDATTFSGMAFEAIELLTGHSLFWSFIQSKKAPVLELRRLQLAEQCTLLPAVEIDVRAKVGAGFFWGPVYFV